jgi:hypothetical protein
MEPDVEVEQRGWDDRSRGSTDLELWMTGRENQGLDHVENLVCMQRNGRIRPARTSNCIGSAVFIYKYKYIMMVKDNKNTVMGCSHCVLLARMHGQRMICSHLCKL